MSAVEQSEYEPAPRRHIWLCADDYGISQSVNAAIRDLVMRGRLNATSVMVAAPGFQRSDAAALKTLNGGGKRVAIGLHVTLTGPFRPMSADFRPVHNGSFLSLEHMLVRSMLRLLSRRRLEREIATQFRTFVTAFGQLPDFVDGHQHVHLFPKVRDALIRVVKDVAPEIWVRQCGGAELARRLADRKTLIIDTLSRRFRVRAAKAGLITNPAFAGIYDFAPDTDLARLFPSFFERMPEGGVVMCHPGFVDEELKELDPLTYQREREYEFLTSDAFAGILRAQRISLA